MNRYVIIPCGGAKLTEPAHAYELYTGSMFRDALGTALMMTSWDSVFIMSAKYGLVTLDTVLPPYDLKMGQPGSVTVSEIQRDMRELFDYDTPFTVEALLPKAYLSVLENAYDYEVENHYANCAGIGYQKARLASIRERLAA